MGERKGVCTVLAGRPDGKRPPRRPGCGWENIIKINVQEIDRGGVASMDWIDLG
jgi:hypothetical protein